MARPRPSTTDYADTRVPASTPIRRPLIDRWYGKLLLLLVGVILLTLSYAPFKQFWAGWIGAVPFIIVLSRTAGPWRAAFWWWLAGVLFFSANVWWLLKITGPGVLALVLWLGLYWALAAVLLRPLLIAAIRPAPPTADVPDPADAAAAAPAPPAVRAGIGFVLLLAMVWVGAEWIRGNWPFQGFSWFNLSYAQTPVLHLCQIADIFGEHGISFWVAMVNALAALFVLNGWRWRGLLRPVLLVGGTLAAIAVYGVWRFAQTDAMLTPGPTVLVVQPNIPQSNTGNKGAPAEEIIDFHVSQTNLALQQHPQTDLVVWSETMMPQLNETFFADLARQNRTARDSERARRLITDLARHYKVSLLVGGSYVGKTTLSTDARGEQVVDFAGRRNSAYYFQRDSGRMVDRFDKVHLVPFGEYIPFEQASPWLYRQLIALGPPDMENYQLERGDRAVIFDLPKDRQPATQPAGSGGSTADGEHAWRFVTPICFEDADAELNAWFFRGGAARGSIDRKQADFIVNISNDGWFDLTMMPQHFQVGTLRSIENRVPTARSVNTGISGFIDSLGRSHDDLKLPAYSEGVLTHQIMLDRRTTFFTRWGNLLGPACAIGMGVLAAVHIVRWRRAKRGVDVVR